MLAGNVNAFSPSLSQKIPHTVVAQSAATSDEATVEDAAKSGNKEKPLLIRRALGEETDRTPVWMMRQAGRHMQCYRDLCKKYPTFRQRSETPEVSCEISLQPVRAYQTDGCILFSDILTPLPGMGVDFDIGEKVGPVVEPIRSYDALKKVCEFLSAFTLQHPLLPVSFSTFFLPLALACRDDAIFYNYVAPFTFPIMCRVIE